MGAVGGLLPAIRAARIPVARALARDLTRASKHSCRSRIFWIVQASALLVFAVPFRWALVALWAVSHFLRAIGLTLVVPPLLRAPRVQDEPRRALRLGVHRHRGDAEGAALVGRPSRQPSQVRRSRRRSAQPDGQRLLLRAHRLVPERHASTTASRRRNPVIRDFGKVPEIALARALLLRAAARAGASTMYLRRRLAVARLGLLPADDDAGARDVRDQHRQPHVRIAPVRDASTSRATTRSRRSSRPAKGGTTTTTAIQRAARNGFYWWEFDLDVVRDPRDGGRRIWCGTSRPVPKRIYDEARAVEGRARPHDVPSVVDAMPLARARRRRRARTQRPLKTAEHAEQMDLLCEFATPRLLSYPIRMSATSGR